MDGNKFHNHVNSILVIQCKNKMRTKIRLLDENVHRSRSCQSATRLHQHFMSFDIPGVYACAVAVTPANNVARLRCNSIESSNLIALALARLGHPRGRELHGALSPCVVIIARSTDRLGAGRAHVNFAAPRTGAGPDQPTVRSARAVTQRRAGQHRTEQ
jgi:hypothetical protein